MANIASLAVILTAKTGPFRRGLGRAQGRLRRFGNFVKKASRVMLSFAAAGAKATGAILGLSTIIGARFEQSMARVRARTGAAAQEFERLESLARTLGARTSFSAKQAADAMDILAKAGFSVNQIIGTTPKLLALAEASSVDLKTAAGVLSDAMKGLGLTVGDSGRIVDVFAKGVNLANTDIVEFQDALKFVAPVARELGISLEDTTAAILRLQDAGSKGTIAGTQLRFALIALATPQVQKKLEDLGVAIRDDATGGMRNFIDILKDVDKSMDALGGDLDRVGTLTELFGRRAGPGVASLLGEGIGRLDDFRRELNNAGGEAQRIADIQLDTLAGSFKILISAIKELAITIGKFTGPTVRKLVEGMTFLVQIFTQFLKVNRQVIIAIGQAMVKAIKRAQILFGGLGIAVVNAVGGLFSLGSTASTARGKLITFFAVITAALRSIPLLIDIMQKGVEGLIRMLVFRFTKQLPAVIKNALIILSNFGEAAAKIGLLLAEAFARPLIDFLKKVAAFAGKLGLSIAEEIKKIASETGGALEGPLDKLKAAAAEAKEFAFRGTVDIPKLKDDPAFKGIKNDIGGLARTFSGEIQKAREELVTPFVDAALEKIFDFDDEGVVAKVGLTDKAEKALELAPARRAAETIERGTVEAFRAERGLLDRDEQVQQDQLAAQQEGNVLLDDIKDAVENGGFAPSVVDII